MVKLGIIGGGQLGLMLCESALKIYFITHIYIFSDKCNDISCNIAWLKAYAALHNFTVKNTYTSSNEVKIEMIKA